MLAETGARPGEALTLTWGDIACEAPPDSVVLYTRKSPGGHRVPRRLQMSEELAVKFCLWRRATPSARYVFQADNGGPHFPVWAEKRLRGVLRGLGLGWFSVGCLRHAYASRLAAEGVPLVQIQSRLGHTKLTTTERYIREIEGV